MLLSESTTIEFKRQVTDEIRKTVIAFANTEGGSIYVGLNDDGSITGIENADSEMLRLSNMIRDSIKPDITMFVSYSSGKMQDRNVIVVTVQKGTGSPYYLASKGLRPEGVFVRHGASSVPATENAIRKMIKDTDGDNFEKMRSLNQELTFKATMQVFEDRKILFGDGQFKTLRFINEDGLFTNLALLLSDQCSHTIKAAVFEGTSKTIFKDRREFDGSILKQLNDAYAYISLFNRVRAEFSGLYRNDYWDYPEEALRETLLNALVHRDYSYSSSTLISIFEDRIEFVTLGGLVRGVSLSDMMLGVSVTRNEWLANDFYRLKLIEAYGTGVPKILKSYEGCPVQPKFETSDNAFKITLPNQNSIQSRTELSEAEMTVIKLVESKGKIARKDAETELGVSQTLSGRILKNLVVKEILQTIGNGKNLRYILKKP